MRREVAAWLRFVADRLDPPQVPLPWINPVYTTSTKWKVRNG